MGKIKTTFIATVLNEESKVDALLESVFYQSILPDEVILVDGGSTDKTVEKIKSKFKKFKGKLLLLEKRGNRSIGRNEAIRHAVGEIIACSDAGCILDKNWLKEITEPFMRNEIEVVAGYYQGRPSTIFQKCLVPYVLVMPDKINPKFFLPATRSIAFRKSVWKKLGGFPEKFSHNEDYVFAKKMQEATINITFARNAVVYWMPRKNAWESFKMFFRFALGDAEAAILRPKVVLILMRYLVGTLLFISAIIRGESVQWFFLLALIAFYCAWAAFKNYRYIKDLRAIIILPAIQIISDVAVIAGTSYGLFLLWNSKRKQ